MRTYFNTLIQPYFVICVIAYLLIRLDRATQWILWPEFIRYNMNDFLCLPIILTLTTCILRYLKQDSSIQLSGILIFGEALFYSVLFEVLLPLYSITYTADYIDVIMYILGAYFYWVMINKTRLYQDWLNDFKY